VSLCCKKGLETRRSGSGICSP